MVDPLYIGVGGCVGVGGGGYFVHCCIVLLVLVVAEGNLKPELREIICAHRPPALTVGDLLKFSFKTIFSPTFILKEQTCLLLSMKTNSCANLLWLHTTICFVWAGKLISSLSNPRAEIQQPSL